jgi:hypothetical protein
MLAFGYCSGILKSAFWSYDMTEQIEFRCEHCGKRFAADPKHAGRKSKCSACKQPVRVPNLKSKSDETSDSSSRPRPGQKPEPVNVTPAQPDETIQAALRQAEQFSKLINESLEIASTSDEPDTKLLEIDFAKQNLDLLKQHLATYPAIEMSSFGDLEDRVVTLDSAFEQAGLRRLVAKTHVESEPVLAATEPAVDKTIRFPCPRCNVEMTAPANPIGQQFQCPNCQQIGSIPWLPSADTSNTGASAVASTKAANIIKKTLVSWKASYESLSQDTKRTTLLVGLILSITVFFIWPYISHRDPASNRRRAATETLEIKVEAWTFTQILVEQRLKSPSTASFGSLLGEDQSPLECVLIQGDDEYLATGWVDSQNAFGATIRSRFKCLLRHNATGDSEWTCYFFEMEGRIYIDRRAE